jgi:hypothetical protein
MFGPNASFGRRLTPAGSPGSRNGLLDIIKHQIVGLNFRSLFTQPLRCTINLRNNVSIYQQSLAVQGWTTPEPRCRQDTKCVADAC